MDWKKDIIEQTRIIQNFIVEKVANSEADKKITNNDARLLNEALFAVSALLDFCNYEPHNKVILQKTYRFGLDVVYEKLFYYTGYYYSYSKLSKGDLDEQQRALFQVNVNTATAISVFEGYRNGICGIGGSTDEYYIERMPKVIWGLENVLKFSKEEVYIPSLYVIYNLGQSLSLYLKSGHKTYRNSIKNLLNKILELQEKFHALDSVKQILKENTQLNLFKNYQYKNAKYALYEEDFDIKLDIPDLKEFKSENSLRIINSVFYFDKKLFIDLFEYKYEDIVAEISKQRVGLNNFLFVKCLAQYINAKRISETIDFNLQSLQKNKIDFSNHISHVFRNYSQSASVNLTEGDLNMLLNYDDETLREKVANTIENVDPHIIARERKKPHGASEISDMEIPIKLEGKKFYMCMPFKSGVEISSKTVPVNISYQIFRPFLDFDNCIVVFITAKRSSQYLMNYIKKMQSKFGWNISVIEHEELAKLLKMNGELN